MKIVLYILGELVMVREKITVITKTYPELSKKHGPIVCVAGINQYGEWRRLYPIPVEIWMSEKYKQIRFKKWDVIEISVDKHPPPHDGRFESRKINDLSSIVVKRHIDDWGERISIIKEILDPDIESIIESGRSLGVIKPRKVLDFFDKPRSRLRDEAEKIVAQKMEEADSKISLLEYIEVDDRYLLPYIKDSDVKIEKIPWIGYKFYCMNPNCKGHEMMVIDWEAQELFRKYRTVEGPVKKKLFDELVFNRDLYFIVGNTWRFHRSFMIIGLFYPPKNYRYYKPITSLFESKPTKPKLSDFMKG